MKKFRLKVDHFFFNKGEIVYLSDDDGSKCKGYSNDRGEQSNRYHGSIYINDNKLTPCAQIYLGGE